MDIIINIIQTPAYIAIAIGLLLISFLLAVFMDNAIEGILVIVIGVIISATWIVSIPAIYILLLLRKLSRTHHG